LNTSRKGRAGFFLPAPFGQWVVRAAIAIYWRSAQISARPARAEATLLARSSLLSVEVIARL
jgi:hypothetical protein